MPSLYPALRDTEDFPKACSASVTLVIYKIRHFYCYRSNAQNELRGERLTQSQTWWAAAKVGGDLGGSVCGHASHWPHRCGIIVSFAWPFLLAAHLGVHTSWTLTDVLCTPSGLELISRVDSRNCSLSRHSLLTFLAALLGKHLSESINPQLTSPPLPAGCYCKSWSRKKNISGTQKPAWHSEVSDNMLCV